MKCILIDCDPGHDDMMAIMLACSSPELKLLGVTTVGGNQTGEKTYLNALKTLTLIGERDIPVARGADKPLFRELTVAPEIHGVSGLDGADLPEPGFEGVVRHAVDFLIQTIMESGTPLTLVPTGPLTNVALAMLKDPRITTKLERIVLMGGAVFDSNITPAAEFNIYVDPEAAKVVFGSGVPVTMVGLDVTNKALFGFDDIERLARSNGKVSRVVAPLLKFFAQANKTIFGFEGAPLHDALAVAHLIKPEVIKTRRLNVEIETDGELTRGRTVADVYGVTGKPANTDVALEVDNDLFKELLVQAIKILDSR
ncbi:MAG: nucleoside hydrolase [Spirochaetaceae bacterium]|nr:MAG: nucleoside hydrolase [Spirochaetaceae bacterium]